MNTDFLWVCSRKLPCEDYYTVDLLSNNMASRLTPQSFVNTLPSLLCIITMLTLIHSHLNVVIRLHLMLLHCSYLSLLYTPPLSPSLPLPLIMDFLQILLVCDGDQVSHFGFMNLRLLSFNLSLSPSPLPSCICPSIIPRVGLGGRVLIPPSHLSLL